MRKSKLRAEDKKRHVITFEIDKDTKREIEQAADREERTVSGLCRYVMRRWLRENKPVSVASIARAVESDRLR